MKVFKGIVLGALILTFSFLVSFCEHRKAYGSPLECESIHDPDQRNYCRAVSKKQKSYCEFIKNNDLRHRCRAEVR